MKILEALAKLCAILAGALLTVITLVTCVSLIGRNTIGKTIVGDFELTASAAGAAISSAMRCTVSTTALIGHPSAR